MQILVAKDYSDTPIIIEVGPSDNIGVIKAKVQEKMAIAVDRQRIIFRPISDTGHLLKGSRQALDPELVSDCGIIPYDKNIDPEMESCTTLYVRQHWQQRRVQIFVKT